MKVKEYRDNGAIGALLDEYEKSIEDMIEIIDRITSEQLIYIVDTETKDEDCRSIQTILTHVVRAGYGYVNILRIHLGEQLKKREGQVLNSIDEYKSALRDMFSYNVQLFKDYPDVELEEHDLGKKISVSWGQFYDVEQLMEHAIVHVLRHRRQIERFLIKMN